MKDKWKILIAEDESDWCDVALRHLTKDGNWEPTVVKSLNEAKKIINEGRNFDVALIDLGLGGGFRFDPKSGEELAELLKENGAKVGLFSGLTAEVSRAIARRLGAPLFDKSKIHNFVELANQTLYWEPEDQKERTKKNVGIFIITEKE